MIRERSAALYSRATQLMPGGVNSPVRAFGSVNESPIFIESAAGPHVFDVDGNRYTDFVCSWGPLILGHAHPSVVEAIRTAAAQGTSFGATTEREVELAEKVIQAVPSLVTCQPKRPPMHCNTPCLSKIHWGRQQIQWPNNLNHTSDPPKS